MTLMASTRQDADEVIGDFRLEMFSRPTKGDELAIRVVTLTPHRRSFGAAP